MRKIRNKVLIIIAVLIVILYVVSNMFKLEIALLFVPKSYVLLCMESTLEEEWRDIQKIYNTSMGFKLTAKDEENEILSLMAYNNKKKAVFASPQLTGDGYIGFFKDNAGTKSNTDTNKTAGKESNKSSSNTTDTTASKTKSSDKEDMTSNTSAIPSLIELYTKYATVSKEGSKSFALVNSEEGICEADEFKVTLNRDIIEVVPRYVKKFIADENILKKVEDYLNKIDSDIIVYIYIDDSDKIRSIKVSYSYDKEDALAEITFNDWKNYWNNLTCTYIRGGETVTVKSVGNHDGEGDQYTDETTINVLSGVMTKVQLKATTNIDLNKTKDNVDFKIKGDVYSFPLSLEGTGDLLAGDEVSFQANMNLKLKFEEYQLSVNMNKEENDLKNVKSFDGIGSLNSEEKQRILDWLQDIL